MSELIANVIVILAIALTVVGMSIGAFAGALFIYFYGWRRSLKEPGEQA